MIYKFPKALYRRKEMLDVIQIASSTIDVWIARLKSEKRDLRDMGCYQLKGCKYDIWNPIEFIQFIEKEQTQLRVGRPKKKVGFGYEEAQLNEINHVLTVVNNNHQLKEKTIWVENI